MIDIYQFENGLQNGQILISQLIQKFAKMALRVKSPMVILKSWQVWHCEGQEMLGIVKGKIFFAWVYICYHCDYINIMKLKPLNI
jgi:hypothetical protein